MLGKGLESLIPPQSSENPKVNGQALPDGSIELAHADFGTSALPRIRPPEVPRRTISNAGILGRKPVSRQDSASKKETETASHRHNLSRGEAPADYERGSLQKERHLTHEAAIFHIELTKIKPNPEQPRRNFDPEALKELANSIREFGVLQPLLVSKIERETDGGQEVEYQLIAGERRLRAAELAGMTQVPVFVRKPISRREQLELAIIENLQREDLNPIEAARAFSRLQDEFRLTQREIASRLGKSRESIANTLRLLSLPSSVQLALEGGKLNESQGRMLLMVENPGEQERLFNEILSNKLSVRELRNKIKHVAKLASAEQKSDGVEPFEEYDDPEVTDLREQLETFFGAPVTIRKQGESGRIVIEFYSPEELRGIAMKLAKSTDSEESDQGYLDEFVV